MLRNIIRAVLFGLLNAIIAFIFYLIFNPDAISSTTAWGLASGIGFYFGYFFKENE